ncbi:MAG: DUF1549 domain-containing protein, partial [Bryobacteraceae bacterium]
MKSGFRNPARMWSQGLFLLGSWAVLLGAEKADFARDVQPILHARCAGCHGSEKPQGGLSVYTRSALLKGGSHGPAVAPRSSGTSLLIARVSGGAMRMPLGQPPLSDAEIRILSSWIDAGAEWNPNGLPLQGQIPIAPRNPQVPGAGHPIDAFVARYSKTKGIPIPPLAADAVFARRAYLDLVGLPPTPEEQMAFAAGKRPDKRDRLIDRVLNDRRRYAEHWMTLW